MTQPATARPRPRRSSLGGLVAALACLVALPSSARAACPDAGPCPAASSNAPTSPDPEPGTPWSAAIGPTDSGEGDPTARATRRWARLVDTCRSDTPCRCAGLHLLGDPYCAAGVAAACPPLTLPLRRAEAYLQCDPATPAAVEVTRAVCAERRAAGAEGEVAERLTAACPLSHDPVGWSRNEYRAQAWQAECALAEATPARPTSPFQAELERRAEFERRRRAARGRLPNADEIARIARAADDARSACVAAYSSTRALVDACRPLVPGPEYWRRRVEQDAQCRSGRERACVRLELDPSPVELDAALAGCESARGPAREGACVRLREIIGMRPDPLASPPLRSPPTGCVVPSEAGDGLWLADMVGRSASALRSTISSSGWPISREPKPWHGLYPVDVGRAMVLTTEPRIRGTVAMVQIPMGWRGTWPYGLPPSPTRADIERALGPDFTVVLDGRVSVWRLHWVVVQAMWSGPDARSLQALTVVNPHVYEGLR